MTGEPRHRGPADFARVHVHFRGIPSALHPRRQQPRLGTRSSPIHPDSARSRRRVWSAVPRPRANGRAESPRRASRSLGVALASRRTQQRWRHPPIMGAVQASSTTRAAVAERRISGRAARVGKRERRAPFLFIRASEVAMDVRKGCLPRRTWRARRRGARTARGLEQTHGSGRGHGGRRRRVGVKRRDLRARALSLQQTDHRLRLFSGQIVALLQSVEQVRGAGTALILARRIDRGLEVSRRGGWRRSGRNGFVLEAGGSEEPTNRLRQAADAPPQRRDELIQRVVTVATIPTARAQSSVRRGPAAAPGRFRRRRHFFRARSVGSTPRLPLRG